MLTAIPIILFCKSLGENCSLYFEFTIYCSKQPICCQNDMNFKHRRFGANQKFILESKICSHALIEISWKHPNSLWNKCKKRFCKKCLIQFHSKIFPCKTILTPRINHNSNNFKDTSSLSKNRAKISQHFWKFTNNNKIFNLMEFFIQYPNWSHIIIALTRLILVQFY